MGLAEPTERWCSSAFDADTRIRLNAVTQQFPGCRDLLALAATQPGRYPCLLESAARNGVNSRFDILFAFPQFSIELGQSGELRIPAAMKKSGKFLDTLDTAWSIESTLANDDGLPFHGGWVVYLGYELAGEIEPKLKLPAAASSALPVALALRCPAALIVDHERACTIAIAEKDYAHLLPKLVEDFGKGLIEEDCREVAAVVEEDDPQRYLDGVACVHEYLRNGDVFQVNLSREWRARLSESLPAANLYSRLRHANPAPFCGLLQFDDWAIVSSSPERLVEVRGQAIQTRPIAGTRARFRGDDDAANIRELAGHPKERAEHVMLIDLMRNDLGKICQPGSISVNEMMVVESYAHVHHIVSNVCGQLRPQIMPGQVIAALFPGGTITGCPKVRCMEIIAELEGIGRGPYTGALGYLDRDGSLDLNILIRTIQLHGDRISLRAGAGIVADSVPGRELDETRAKARGLLQALGVGGLTRRGR